MSIETVAGVTGVTESPVESFAIQAIHPLVFMVVTAKGDRTLIVGRPLSVALALFGSQQVKVLYINNLVTGQPEHIKLGDIYDIFPSTSKTQTIVQLCQSYGSPHEVAEAFQAVAMDDDVTAENIQALQLPYISQLKQLVERMQWTQDNPSKAFTEEEYDLLRRAIDAFFMAVNTRLDTIGPGMSLILKDIALDVMEFCPVVKNEWLDSEKAGETIRKLRSRVRDLENQLTDLKTP